MALVSVVIPTHNRPQMLAEALESVRAQSFTDYEIIVASNGESQEMRERSQAVARMAGATWLALDRGNVSAARNLGVAHAKAEWIAFLDDDDIWLPHKLERQMAEAERTGADLVCSDYVCFGGRDVGVIRPRLPEGWSYTRGLSHHAWWALPSAALLRKRVFDAVGGFDERFANAQDMELWRRISWRHTIHQTDEILIRYRLGHANTMHPKNAARRARFDLRHFAKMRRDTPTDLRDALPSFWLFALPRLWRASGLPMPPKFLYQPFHPARLQRRWKVLVSFVSAGR